MGLKTVFFLVFCWTVDPYSTPHLQIHRGWRWRLASAVHVSSPEVPSSSDISSSRPPLELGSKAQFPIFSQEGSSAETPQTYLDTAATSQKPKCVIDAISSYYSTTNSNVHRGAHSWGDGATSGYEQCRSTVANFVNPANPQPSGCVFTSGYTDGLNKILHSMEASNKFDAPCDVISSVMEHHSNMVGWELLSRRRPSVKVSYLPLSPDGYTLDLEKLSGILSDPGSNVKVVSLLHASNTLGTINDLSKILEIIRTSPSGKDICVIVDASQSAPHTTLVPPSSLYFPDFVLFSGHKILGPTGIGVLYGVDGPESFEKFCPTPCWSGGEMIDYVRLGGEAGGLDVVLSEKAPSLYESGTPNIAGVFGLDVAIQTVMATKVEEIHGYLSSLTDYMHGRLLSDIEGIEIMGPPRGEDRAPLISFRISGLHCQDIGSLLNLDEIMVRTGFHCTEPLHGSLGAGNMGGTVRASLGIYNDKDDVDRFVNGLKEVVKMLTANK